jgi:serine protease Do
MPTIETISKKIGAMLEAVQPGVVVVEAEGRGAGAGVIWRSDGAVLTNQHVVANSGRDTRVRLHDGRTFPAVVTGSNSELDLAMLRVEAGDLPAIPVDDSSLVRVGQPVWAIGHPWGQPWLVTSGIVSAIGSFRLRDSESRAPYLRTDLRLRPGNSGGPLVNANGHVIGLNAMILGGDQSLAIPSQAAVAWLAGQPTRRVKLGVGVRPIPIEPALGRSAGIHQPAGLLVLNVQPDSLAERAALLAGDVLLNVAGTPVTDGAQLLNALARHSGQTSLPLTLIRGGQVREVRLAVKPEALEGWL